MRIHHICNELDTNLVNFSNLVQNICHEPCARTFCRRRRIRRRRARSDCGLRTVLVFWPVRQINSVDLFSKNNNNQCSTKCLIHIGSWQIRLNTKSWRNFKSFSVQHSRRWGSSTSSARSAWASNRTEQNSLATLRTQNHHKIKIIWKSHVFVVVKMIWKQNFWVLEQNSLFPTWCCPEREACPVPTGEAWLRFAACYGRQPKDIKNEKFSEKKHIFEPGCDILAKLLYEI